MSSPIELGHLALSINFLAYKPVRANEVCIGDVWAQSPTLARSNKTLHLSPSYSDIFI